MIIHIAVWDPVPVYRQGIIAVLGARGHDVEEPTDLVKWAGRRGRRVIAMTIESDDDRAVLKMLGRLERRPVVVALLSEDDVDVYIKAIAAGAQTAVARRAEREAIGHVFDEVLNGRTSLPTAVVTDLVDRLGQNVECNDLPSKRDIVWLRELSTGVTVAQLAQNVGYSERAMYRHLRELYGRMGVTNRAEAILMASRQHLL